MSNGLARSWIMLDFNSIKALHLTLHVSNFPLDLSSAALPAIDKMNYILKVWFNNYRWQASITSYVQTPIHSFGFCKGYITIKLCDLNCSCYKIFVGIPYGIAQTCMLFLKINGNILINSTPICWRKALAYLCLLFLINLKSWCWFWMNQQLLQL